MPSKSNSSSSVQHVSTVETTNIADSYNTTTNNVENISDSYKTVMTGNGNVIVGEADTGFLGMSSATGDSKMPMIIGGIVLIGAGFVFLRARS